MSRSCLVLLSLPLMLGATAGCGEAAGGADDPGLPAAFGPQPRITPSGAEDTLGASLGAGETGAPDGLPGVIRQAVAGAGHVCVLDDAGAAFCISDLPIDAHGSFPRRWTRVEGAPPLAILYAADETTCGAPLGGGLHCWGQVTWSVPDFVSYTRAREVVRGELQVVGLVLAEGPWSARRICVQTSSTRVSCDLAGEVAHIDFPSSVSDPVVIGETALGRIGDVIYKGDITAGATVTATPHPTFPRSTSLSAVTAALACGVAASGEGHCVTVEGDDAGDALPPGVPMFAVAPGSTLSGGCALTPSGAVACGLPSSAATACDLGLVRFQAVGARGCGPTADGQWRCIGRRGAATHRTLPGLIDHAGCPR